MLLFFAQVAFDKISPIYFFEHQLETRKSKDWATQILKDLIDFEIDITMEEIQNTPIENWKKSIKIKTTQNALNFLN